MKQNFGSNAVSITHSAWRIVVGFLFACHGAASLFGILGGHPGLNGGAIPFGIWPYWWGAVIQLIGGSLVALGLFTRVTALICSGSMAFAYFSVHLKNGILPIQNEGELAALYAWQFLMITAVGPGRWALDTILHKSIDKSTTATPEKEQTYARV